MNKEYPYEKIYWQEFEDIVIKICHSILGIGATKFSTGKDGGRDSTFEGEARNFPSDSKPWAGKFIIQAKHTTDPTASCSDSEFSGLKKDSIISKELKRLNKLTQTDPFDNYLLFTNRKLSGDKHAEIRDRIKKELRIENVAIIGRDLLNIYITEDIAEEFDLINYIIPLRFFEKDIQDVIVLFYENKGKITGKLNKYNTQNQFVSKEKKNRLNILTKDYFEFIKTHSLQHFTKIEIFLRDPKNRKYTEYYENTVGELQGKIIVRRDDFATFDEILEHIADKILESDVERMRNSRKMIRVFLHFMYWNCDIGKKNDKTT